MTARYESRNESVGQGNLRQFFITIIYIPPIKCIYKAQNRMGVQCAMSAEITVC